jgi:uncharacterized protein YqjF (DUF2071 family)
MIFSTHPPEAIPNVGDFVTLGHDGVPYAVTKRTMDIVGQVYLTLDSDPPRRVQVEAVNWWPQVGDLCTGLPVPYRQWLAQQWADATRYQQGQAFGDYNNGQSWLYGEFTIKAINHDMATVTGARFSGAQQIPVHCCAVLSRPSIQRVLEFSA